MHDKVSSRHALISFRDGVFFIQDISRNGVSLNSPDNRLDRERPYALKAGDVIFIEPYEIDVSVGARPERQAFPPLAEDDPSARPPSVDVGDTSPQNAAPLLVPGPRLRHYQPLLRRGSRGDRSIWPTSLRAPACHRCK